MGLLLKDNLAWFAKCIALCMNLHNSHKFGLGNSAQLFRLLDLNVVKQTTQSFLAIPL